MKADELLLTLFRNGVSLTVEDDSLHYFAEEEVPGELLQEIREHKEELMQFLQLLRYFGEHIGEVVLTPEGKEGIIWGVSCYGVQVHRNSCVLSYHPLELAVFNGVGSIEA